MSRKLLRRLLAEPVEPGDRPTAAAAAKAWIAAAAWRSIDWAQHAPGLAAVTDARVLRRPLPFTGPADVLLIVPPFASLWYPSLAAHVLQACAREAGFRVDVLYANVMLAAFIGERHYEQIGAESVALAAERFFARCAFGLPPLGHGADQMFEPSRIYGAARGELYRGLYPDGRAASLGTITPISVARVQALERRAPIWLDAVARAIVARGYRIVGCTTTFQQTIASIAILNRVKALAPETVTILGGANCEAEMSEGLAALDAKVDYFFAGESEETFAPFVAAIVKGERPRSRIVQGRPCKDMDAVPFISCREFFEQRRRYLPFSAPGDATFLSYETSRGCWWGQKQHCTFCGLNGEGMGFRRKSPARVIAELRSLVAESPTKNISMTDNIMPHDYIRTLLPQLCAELPGINIFYEQKANLSLEDVFALKSAGIAMIQPGIEALSSSLLKLMRKGVQARQNIVLLRYSRIAGVRLVWNLLCGFPNDELASYRDTLAIVPLLTHLQPPSGMWHLSIDRFSPYFFESARHNVTNVRPLPVYGDFFPPGADLNRIAYHFLGDYPCDTHRHIDVIRELNAQVVAWIRAWAHGPRRRPELKIARHQDRYLLVDTRGLPATTELREIDRDEAAALLTARPYRHGSDEDAAIARKLAVVVDNWFVPLPVARQELFVQLTGERHTRAA